MSVRGSLRRACAWVLTTAVIAAGLVLGQAPDAGAEDRPALRFEDASISEGNAGTAVFAVTVSLSAAAGDDVTFGWLAWHSERQPFARHGVDYRLVPGEDRIARIPAGARSTTIELEVVGDTFVEPDEQFGVAIDWTRAVPTTVDVADPQSIVTILDDGDAGEPEPAAPSVAVDRPSVIEGDEGSTTVLPFAVSLSHAVPWNVIVTFTADEREYPWPGATSGEDFMVPTPASIIIPAGDTSGTFEVAVPGDGEVEADEQVVLQLSSDETANVGTSEYAQGTIRDDDDPDPSALPVATVEDAEAREGDVIAFPVSLSKPSNDVITIIGVLDGGSASSADIDEEIKVRIAPGRTAGELRSVVVDDVDDEGAESAEYQLYAFGASLARDRTTGGLLDDDEPVTIGIGVPRAHESDEYAEFAFLVSGEHDHPITFHYATVDGTAVAGQDYVASSGTVTIPAGAPHIGVRVPLLDDDEDEDDHETFTLALTDVNGAEMPSSTQDGWIYDDDEPVVPDVSVAASEAYEDDGAIAFTITLSEPTTVPVEVTYSTGDSTSSGGAQHARDFRFTSGTVQLAPGATTAVISVPLIDDVVPELDESFRFLLQSALGGTVVTPRVNGTIHDDDPVRLGSVV